ncbi:LOW QUALITY PROTEIN: hypothetical protein YC2023_045738 [Brassica napus]
MSRVLHLSSPYDHLISQKFPIHDHPLYSTTDHGQCAGCYEGKELSAEFLECPECDIFFHKECIELSPEVITHSFHPQNGCMCCSLCGEQLMLLVYRCLICDFKLDMSCAKNPPLLEIDQPKVDQHKLHLLMKKVSFTCDACGFEGDRSPYMCLPCNFMYHIRCVYFPDDSQQRSYSLSPRTWSCGCRYVHSDVVACEKIKKTRELENKPSKGDDDDDYPFKIVEDKYIDHFTHEHYLAFHKDGKVSDVSKRCQACKLPVVYIPYFCCCKGCEFYLHEGCANLPRKKRSILHNHPLELDGKSTARTEFHAKHFCCSACGQFHDGFKYSCCDFNLDDVLQSICPSKHQIHEHLLTIKSNDLQICSVCKLWVSPVLSCATCGFHLGFDCAQLPKLERHKYDDHLLSLDFVKDETCEGDYWCEICEKKIGGKTLFYTCNEDYCCSTFHTHCVIGALHSKLKQCFKLLSHEFEVV